MPGQNVDTTEPLLSTHLRVGERVGGRYRIDALLGGGGMASVYRGTHEALQQRVAIKVVSPQIRALPGVAERFIREARAATQLKSEHVARVFDVGATDDGAPFMVMELLEGSDLGAVIDSRGPAPIEDAIDWVLQACEALAEVHGVGIVHRDLKPANLFLSRGADGLGCVKLIDFGISRFESPLTGSDAARLTQPETVMGSPHYMAPEQMESASKADVRSDIWGIGAVLYELLSAESPYQGDSYRDLYVAALNAPPEPPSIHRDGIPSGLDAVVLRCLKTDPEDRFADVAELAEALAPFGSEEATGQADNVARILAEARHRVAHVDDAEDSSTSRTPSRVRRRSESRRRTTRRRRVAAVIGLLAIAAGAYVVTEVPEARVEAASIAARLMPQPPPVAPIAPAPPAARVEEPVVITQATVEAAPPPSPPITSASTASASIAVAAPPPVAFHPRPMRGASPTSEAVSTATENTPDVSPSDKLFEDRK